MHHDALSMERAHQENQRDGSSGVDSISFRNVPSSHSERASHDSCRACHTQALRGTRRLKETHGTMFEWFDDQSETRSSYQDDAKDLLDLRTQLRENDSILDAFSRDESTEVYRLLHAPGDILGHVDLLNGQKYTETCRCITNTLVRGKSTFACIHRRLNE